MKVSIVTHKFVLTDGQGRVNYKLAEYLAKAGHRVTLVSTEADASLVALPNVTWRRVAPPAWLPTSLLRYQYFAHAARRAVLREPGGFDIVQVNGFIAYVQADVNASHFVHSNWLKSPYHGGKSAKDAYHRFYTRLNAGWERGAYRNARRIVAVSDFVRDSLVNDCGVDPARIEVIFNGVDTDEFRPLDPGETNALRSELRLPPQAFLGFFAGDLKTSRKNLDLALRSLAELGDRYHLAVAGDTTGSPYPGMAAELGLAGRVHFLGHRRDVPALLRGADVLLFASHYDPFALVITEAMASGLPVITAPTVGASFLIEQGRNGFVLSDDNDVAGMTEYTRRLADDRHLTQKIGAAARTTAEQLTWDAMAQRYELLYQQVLDRKQPIRPDGLELTPDTA